MAMMPGKKKQEKLDFTYFRVNFAFVAGVSDYASRSLKFCRLPGGSQAGPGR
jgi:hypothetical protein